MTTSCACRTDLRTACSGAIPVRFQGSRASRGTNRPTPTPGMTTSCVLANARNLGPCRCRRPDRCRPRHRHPLRLYARSKPARSGTTTMRPSAVRRCVNPDAGPGAGAPGLHRAARGADHARAQAHDGRARRRFPGAARRHRHAGGTVRGVDLAPAGLPRQARRPAQRGGLLRPAAGLRRRHGRRRLRHAAAARAAAGGCVAAGAAAAAGPPGADGHRAGRLAVRVGPQLHGDRGPPQPAAHLGIRYGAGEHEAVAEPRVHGSPEQALPPGGVDGPDEREPGAAASGIENKKTRGSCLPRVFAVVVELPLSS